jgi:hypothetical protein
VLEEGDDGVHLASVEEASVRVDQGGDGRLV